jgi:hypothetical protein
MFNLRTFDAGTILVPTGSSSFASQTVIGPLAADIAASALISQTGTRTAPCGGRRQKAATPPGVPVGGIIRRAVEGRR